MKGQLFHYKGYVGMAWLDLEAGILRGEVIDVADTITFQSDTIAGLEREFRESVDVYLEFCASRGREPSKPFSGRLLLRMPPKIHRILSAYAKAQGQSVNKVVNRCLTKAALRFEKKMGEKTTSNTAEQKSGIVEPGQEAKDRAHVQAPAKLETKARRVRERAKKS